jgi:hypothetical protein
MTPIIKLDNLTVEQLVERFTSITLDQDRALRSSNHGRFNRLFDDMEAVKQELQSRNGDQRRALLPLYDHPNPQVRLKAAKATLAVAPETALKMLRTIAESREYPQAGEAGISLDNLKDGIFKPT